MAEITGAPEMLGGRVKTLHPKVHGGILADRSDPSHLADLAAQHVEPIDLVVCNLYPFSSDPSIELIDVGGPTMVRAAAKNHAHVGVVVDPADYGVVLEELRAAGSLSSRHASPPGPCRLRPHRRRTTPPSWRGSTPAERAGSPSCCPPRCTSPSSAPRSCATARTPTNAGRAIATGASPTWWDGVVQHGGTALSYLNLFDADAAWRLVTELGTGRDAAVAIIKHANPCGAALAPTLADAYRRALECDPVSAFGGVVALGGPCTVGGGPRRGRGPAGRRHRGAVVRPRRARGPDQARRKATRLLEAPPHTAGALELRSLGAGFLVQDADHLVDDALGLAGAHQGSSHRRPVARHRAGVAGVCPDVVQRHRGRRRRPGPRGRGRPAEPGGSGPDRGGQGGGPGPGRQPPPATPSSRSATGSTCSPRPGWPRWSSRVDRCKDGEVVAAADEHGIAMVLTGERHFRH